MTRKTSAVSNRRTAVPVPNLYQRSADDEDVEKASTDEIVATTDETVPERVQDPKPRSGAGAASKSEDTPAPEPKEKRTFHLDKQDLLLLGAVQLKRWENTGKKPKFSDLVGEGIRLLAENSQVTRS